ncbi:hypothetical protein GCM10009836_53360 [Pseudonocardia ailaonensis]|uniref:Uncharacterized protein n=1 Tax=Pseudonocardia ailaonensis TaxID=367279 RepID=A0ABN2NH22_9PSEU
MRPGYDRARHGIRPRNGDDDRHGTRRDPARVLVTAAPAASYAVMVTVPAPTAPRPSAPAPRARRVRRPPARAGPG